MRSPLSLALLPSRVDTTGGSAVTSCGGRAVPPRLGPVTSMLRASAQGQGVGAGPRATRSPLWPPLDPPRMGPQPQPRQGLSWPRGPWPGLVLGVLAEPAGMEEGQDDSGKEGKLSWGNVFFGTK